MTKGLLIYDREGAKRNKVFIDMLIDRFGKRGIELCLVIFEEMCFGIDSEKPFVSLKDADIKDFSFAVCRCINPLLSRHLELLGLKVFNKSEISRICNSKNMTYSVASELGIPVPITYFGKRGTVLEFNDSDFPLIVKSDSGHGGAEVFWANNMHKLTDAVKRIDADYVVQKPVSELGKDLRIYVVGKTIVGAVLRTSEKDFRSNFSLGGSAKLVTPQDNELKIAKKLIDHFDFGMVGIDIIYDNGKPLLNEIEDVVGSRMLYASSDIDIADLYAEHIANTLAVSTNKGDNL